MGRQSSLAAFLDAQAKAGKHRSALITDIDNTFYHRSHRDAAAAAWGLRKRATAAPYPIIAITGADFEHVHRRMESGELPLLEAIVGNVGTDIWLLEQNGAFVRDRTYAELLGASGYDRREVVRTVKLLLPIFHKRGIRIQFQDPDREAALLVYPDPDYLPYKVSLHFFGDDQTVQQVQEVYAREFPEYSVVICEEIHRNALITPNDQFKKYCLDILPATKADAMQYLIASFNVQRGVVAGDSGNDIAMLLKTPDDFIAVAVGGHKPELRTALEAQTAGRPIFIDTDQRRRAAQTLLLFDDYLRGGPVPNLLF